MPLQVDLSWVAEATGSIRAQQWDTDKMMTEKGRKLIADLHLTAPLVAWGVSADEHLHVLNQHLFRGLSTHFVKTLARPRQMHVSEQQWEVTRMRRHARRFLRKIKQLRQRLLLARCMVGWKDVSRQLGGHSFAASGSGSDASCWRQCICRTRFAEARIGLVIRSLSAQLRKLHVRDVAKQTREAIQQARGQGQGALLRLTSSLMKYGRRYKPPGVAPCLHIEGTCVAAKSDVLHALERHFAKPEHGMEMKATDFVEQRALRLKQGCHKLEGVPTFAGLADGFARLACKKAAGVSGLPPELYRAAPYEAARVHLPLVLKAALNGDWPFLWVGTQTVAVPKPQKPPGTVQGWRSIALYEAAAKGIGKSVRKTLIEALEAVACRSQCGARKKLGIGLPGQYIRSYVQLLTHHRQSGAVLFLDGRDAYYSILRDHLFDGAALSSPEQLQAFVEALHGDVSEQNRLLAVLAGPGLLSTAAVPHGLICFLRNAMVDSWFAMSLFEDRLQATHTGSVPGTPLADILYQYTQTVFLQGLSERLEVEGSADVREPCRRAWTSAKLGG